MSGATSSHSGLTRRSFLKATGAVAGAAAVTGVATPTLQALAADYESGQKESEQERIFRGVCRPNCFAFCHLNVHVRDGKVVKTSRAPYNEKCYDRICQRGLSHVHRIYDPARLQYPMRRVEGTERGAGEWERVSWDEALDEIAGKIKSIQTEFGESAVAFLTASGNQSCAITSAYGRLSSLMNASSIGACLDMGSYYGMQAVAGLYISPLMGLQMWEGNEPTDAKNAKTIVVWGANITDAQVQNWHLVKEAMQGGTKLVVIDPVYTQIASKADRWIPIRPGSDTLLKYALMNVVLEKDAQDVAYLQQHTVAPFLVRSDTGMFVRRSDTGIAPVPTGVMNPTTGKEVMDDPYMVLSNGELVSVDETSAPDIEGSYELDGVKCRTAYALLKEEILDHSPEKVSELTEVSVDDIYELAEICMDTPVYHYEGYGPQAYNNGGHTTMAGLTLCALLGNLGKPGASYGAFWGVHMGVNPAYAAPQRSQHGFCHSQRRPEERGGNRQVRRQARADQNAVDVFGQSAEHPHRHACVDRCHYSGYGIRRGGGFGHDRFRTLRRHGASHRPVVRTGGGCECGSVLLAALQREGYRSALREQARSANRDGACAEAGARRLFQA